jgi:hypothetical protein
LIELSFIFKNLCLMSHGHGNFIKTVQKAAPAIGGNPKPDPSAIWLAAHHMVVPELFIQGLRRGYGVFAP